LIRKEIKMSHFGRLDATAGIGNGIALGGTPGDSYSKNEVVFYKTACADTVATAVATVTIPNISTAAYLDVHICNTFDQASHLNESARFSHVGIVVTRQAGIAAVAAVIPIEHSATNAVTNVNQLVMGQIATQAGGTGQATLTVAVTLGAITGGATVSETFTILVASTGSAAYTTTCFGWISCVNQLVGGVTVAGVNT
jgi:hypothetical protein